MKITKKITSVGHSSGIIIDKDIMKKLKLENGDYIEIEIKKAEP